MNFDNAKNAVHAVMTEKKILRPMVRDAVADGSNLKMVWGPLARGQKNPPTMTETIFCGTNDLAREAAHYVKTGCANLGVVAQGSGKAVEAAIPAAFRVEL